MSVDAVAGPPPLELDGIDLSDRDFWVRPPAERHAVFDLLRRERPFAFFAEPVVPYLEPGRKRGRRRPSLTRTLWLFAASVALVLALELLIR